jgi:hypothetical protein
MKSHVLLVIAAMVAIGAATGILKSHPFSHFGKSDMPPIQELQSSRESGKLPVQEFEDRSLVFPRETSR